MPEATQCWICGSTNTRSLRPQTYAQKLDSESFRITDADYGATHALRLCEDCSFAYAESLPDNDLVAGDDFDDDT